MSIRNGKPNTIRNVIAVMLAVMLIVMSFPAEANAASFKKSKPAFKYSNCMSLSNGVQLQWSKVKGAKKYQVYRATSKNGKYKKILTTKKTKVKLSTSKSNGDYFYKVRAVKGKKKSKWSKKIRIFAQSAQIIGYSKTKYSGYTAFTVKVTNRTNKKMYFNGYGLTRNANYSLYLYNTSTKNLLSGTAGNAILNCSSGMAKVIPAKSSATIEILYPVVLAKDTLRGDGSAFLITASFYPNGKSPAFAIGCTDLANESGGAGRLY